MGVAGAGLEADLAERDMLGDGGANALGAALGTAVVVGAPRSVRSVLLAVAVGLTVASERVSFTEVIARTSGLRELDAWGRRPPAPTGHPSTAAGPGA
jgi:UDP-N-acetylmuramyl pentapeptide phosphotransferase/UDP-N-acetylglucosamine-1-phosphate transferase